MKEKRISIFNWFLIRGTFWQFTQTHWRSMTTPLSSCTSSWKAGEGRKDLWGCCNHYLFSQWVDPAMSMTCTVLNIFTSWRETCCLRNKQGERNFPHRAKDWVLNCSAVILFFTPFFPLCLYSRATKS